MGAAAAVLPDDLGERGECTMLGDTGAHALGAQLGASIVAGNGRAGLPAHALAVVAAAVHEDEVTEAAKSCLVVRLPHTGERSGPLFAFG